MLPNHVDLMWKSVGNLVFVKKGKHRVEDDPMSMVKEKRSQRVDISNTVRVVRNNIDDWLAWVATQDGGSVAGLIDNPGYDFAIRKAAAADYESRA